MSLNDRFEVYSLSCNTIRNGLKDKVVGNVKVEVDAWTDTLHVSIYTNDVQYHYERRFWLTFVACGESMSDTVEHILKEYKREVLKHYFKA